MAVMDFSRPEDNKKNELRVPNYKKYSKYSIDELLDLRNKLKELKQDISEIDLELSTR